jgi:uncharacterized protein (DUF302 family)
MNDIDRSVIPFSAERIEWVIGQPYSTTVQRLLSILKKPRQVKIAFLSRFKGPTALKEYLHQVAGEPGLMILGTITHGRMLGLLGGPVQTQMFLIGNPLIALEMMRVHSQAGVYAPLRVMFSGDGPEETTVTYDRPSKIFAQWNEPIFRETGRLLDEKMEALVRKIARTL